MSAAAPPGATSGVTARAVGEPDVERFAEVMRALSDATRLRVLRALAARDLCVCDIAAQVGVSQPLVSHHLKALKAAGLVCCRRDGPWVYYALRAESFESLGLGGLLGPGAILAGAAADPRAVAAPGVEGGAVHGPGAPA